jgi:hypothetical protein
MKTTRSDGSNAAVVAASEMHKAVVSDFHKDLSEYVSSDPEVGKIPTFHTPIDEVIDVGFIPVRTKISLFPGPHENGLHYLRGMPTGQLEPEAFNPGSNKLLCDVIAKVEQQYETSMPEVVSQWKEFARDVLPDTDDAFQHVANHPMEVPFRNQLFNGSGIDVKRYLTQRKSGKCSSHKTGSLFPERLAMSTASVTWERNGERGEDGDMKPYKSIRRSTRVEEGARPLNSCEKSIGEQGWSSDESTGSEEGEEFDAESSELDDEDLDDNRWLTVRRNTSVARYGTGAAYVGKTFSRKIPKNEWRAYGIVDVDKWSFGKVVSVVKNPSIAEGSLHFKFYNHHSHIKGLPANDEEYSYDECIKMMSTAKKGKYQWVREEKRKVEIAESSDKPAACPAQLPQTVLATAVVATIYLNPTTNHSLSFSNNLFSVRIDSAKFVVLAEHIASLSLSSSEERSLAIDAYLERKRCICVERKIIRKMMMMNSLIIMTGIVLKQART